MTTETDMMDYEIIYKFFAKEATPEETDRLEMWLKEDPSHEAEFNKAYELFVLTHMSAGSALADMSCQDKIAKEQIAKEQVAPALPDGSRPTGADDESSRPHRIWRILSYTAAVAASLAAGIFINSHFYTKPAVELINGTTLFSEARPGQRTSVVLSDGTKVELNSDSRIEYPAIFRDGDRRIRLDGEAMFDVNDFFIH